MIVIQSRGKPSNIERLLDNWTKTDATSKVYLRCDEDDLELPKYDLLSVHFPRNWNLMIGPPTSDPWNEAFEMFPDERFYASLHDDAQPLTNLWDLELKSACGRLGVATPYDYNNTRPTTVFVGGDLVRAIGEFKLSGMGGFPIACEWTSVADQVLGIDTHCEDVTVVCAHDSVAKRELEQFNEWVTWMNIGKFEMALKVKIAKEFASDG